MALLSRYAADRPGCCRLLDDRAGQGVTRDKIVGAVQKNGFQGLGLVPLRFSAQDHSGSAGQQLTKVENGRAVHFGTPYQGQAVSPPPNGVPAA